MTHTGARRRWGPRALALGAVLLLGACGGYRPFSWDEDVSWARARQLAYLGEEGIKAPPGRHLVMPGDTVIGLARRYGVPPEQIIALNDLAPPYTIYVGQLLKIRPTEHDPPGVQAGGERPRVHVVRPGDTLSAIAARYGIRLGDLLALNPGVEPRRLRVGMRIRLVAGEPVRAAEGRARRELDRVRRAAAIPAPPLSGKGFLWPVQGEVIARFGRRPNGLRNDGINIAAPEGTPVRAAEAGVVVYAGEAIPAFGRMLIIRHAGGYLTAYAHNRVLLVTVGDVVRRGQIIARVGKSGEVARPQLHFQIRKGRSPQDPLALLGPARRVAARRP